MEAGGREMSGGRLVEVRRVTERSEQTLQVGLRGRGKVLTTIFSQRRVRTRCTTLLFFFCQ